MSCQFVHVDGKGTRIDENKNRKMKEIRIGGEKQLNNGRLLSMTKRNKEKMRDGETEYLNQIDSIGKLIVFFII